MSQQAELERLIQENPENVQNWQVYADFLTSQGDIRGEIIALEIKGTDKSKKAAQRLLKANQERWFESMKGGYRREDWDEDEEEENPTREEDAEEISLLDAEATTLEWKYGFVHSASLDQSGAPEYNDEGYDYYESDGPSVEDRLKVLLQSDASRFLHSLDAQLTGNDYEGTALVNPGSASLRSLFLGDTTEQMVSPTYLGDMGVLAQSLPRLEILSVLGQGSNFSMGQNIEWPHLRELKIMGMYFSDSLFASLEENRFPKLDTLVIDSQYTYVTGSKLSEKHLGFFYSDRLPVLTDLEFSTGLSLETLIAWIANSPLLTRLKSLSLANNTLGEAGGKALLANLDKFRHLQRLDLSHTQLPASLVQQLATEPWMELDSATDEPQDNPEDWQ